MKWVHGFMCVGSDLQRNLQVLQPMAGVCGGHEGCQEGAWTLPKGRQSRGDGREKRLKSVRRGESRNRVEVEETANKCTYSALEGSGWPRVHEGMGSKCGGVVEWTGGELKVAEQPLLQPSRWTLEQKASNVGR